jgi:UDP:flavonoid glycosyltransferase YjiC (YdhE family)
VLDYLAEEVLARLPAPTPKAWTQPSWWGDLDGSRPVIHVTQGTVANENPDLIAPTLAGLADEDVLVVVSTGGRPIKDLKLGTLPANARIATFLSYPELLPRTSVMVTNGGYGGTQLGLAHGLPLIVAGISEDKLDVTARVAWSGAGINLKTAAPTAAQVRQAVRTVLADPRYRQRAQALQAEYARYDAVATGVQLLEQLAATGRPALRSDVPVPARAIELTPAIER